MDRLEQCPELCDPGSRFDPSARLKKPFVISVSGISGSGKTAVVSALRARLPGAPVLCFDDYGDRVYLDDDILLWSERSDYNAWHLEPLAADLARLFREAPDFILLDYPFGTLNHLLGQYIDLTVFLDVPLDVALARRLIRDYTSRSKSTQAADVDEVSFKGLDRELRFYLARSRPAYVRLPETQKPVSDLILDGTKTPDTLAEEILVHIRARRNTGAPSGDFGPAQGPGS
jgi:uridine kinase